MVWHRLADRVAAIPLVLAGPMVRKVTPQSVTIWLALRRRTDVTLSIYTDEAATIRGAAPQTLTTTRIGPNLHMVAVTVTSTAGTPFRPGTIYYYDLAFVDLGSGDNIPFGTALGGDVATLLTYGGHPLPSFVLPPTLPGLRLFHGSCRKPHAPGPKNSVMPDGLALLDGFLEASIDRPAARPHQLILTGDQIYADEVADVLLLVLSEVGDWLVGHETLAYMPPFARTDAIRVAGFTTGDKRSHLMSLGEYLAMYLFVWSNALWPSELPVPADLYEELARRGLAKVEQEARGEQKAISDQRAHAEAFKTQLAAVRKVLANVATYMIFDDHEVTDDWNMYRSFCEDVYGKPLGTRIIQNALVAYALCQHWGNAPEQFAAALPPPAGAQLLFLLSTSPMYETIDEAQVRRFVGVNTAAELELARDQFGVYFVFHETPSLKYHYTVEGPGHLLLMVDTRTWRTFPRPGWWGAPDLISESQLTIQVIEPARQRGNRQLMVAMTTNLAPAPTIRQTGRDLPLAPPVISRKYRNEDMFDGWELERIDFPRLVAALSQTFGSGTQVRDGAVIVLSGDVHASSASRITYWAQSQVGDQASAPTQARIVLAQLVGSALHNGNEKNFGQHEQGYKFVPPDALKQFLSDEVLLQEKFVGWNPQQLSEGQEIYRIKTLKLARQSSLLETLRGTSIYFRGDGDRMVKTLRLETIIVSHIQRIVDSIVTAPHYRFQIDYLTAVDGSHHGLAPRAPAAGGPPLAGYVQRLREYGRYKADVGQGEEMIGVGNLGELRFGADVVSYFVHWDGGGEKWWRRFDVSLKVQDDNYPEFEYPGES